MGMFLMTPLSRQQTRQGCLCLKSKALSLKHTFQLKAIFLHHTHLCGMKLQQGKMQGMLGLQSMLWITFQSSEKLRFKLLLQGREMEHRVRRTGNVVTFRPSRLSQSPWRVTQMFLFYLRASKWFWPKPVVQLYVIHMAIVVGKCCWSAALGTWWYTLMVWGTWCNFCSTPAWAVIYPCVTAASEV